MTMDRIESNMSTYRALRDQADEIEKNPAKHNVADYDLEVEIDGDTYGIKVDEGIAAAEKILREEGADVNRTREIRASLSADIESENRLGEMTVEEAARPLYSD